jgi:hypothetical protein
VLFALNGGIDLKKAMLAILIAMVLVALIGSSLASTSEYSERNTTFSFEQSVQGNGYFMTYMYAKAGNSALKNYAHGSGSLNSELLLSYQNLNRTTHNTYSDFNDFDQNCIQFKEDVAMVYAPVRIAVGNGYYAANPLDYSSLLKEKTWVKNYRAGTSMHHEVEYAHALDKELNVVIKDKRNYTYDPVWEGVGYTSMTINEDVTDGKTHFGVLQANENLASQASATRDLSDSNLANMKYSAWRKPTIEIDEDYWGTYHIEKNMTLEVPYYIKRTTDDWLPCCFGGYLDSTYPKTYMGLKSAKGIFDCTCFKAPTQAQFPRVYNP